MLAIMTHAELILRADLAKVDARYSKGETAAAAVVTGLDDLVLQASYW